MLQGRNKDIAFLYDSLHLSSSARKAAASALERHLPARLEIQIFMLAPSHVIVWLWARHLALLGRGPTVPFIRKIKKLGLEELTVPNFKNSD